MPSPFRIAIVGAGTLLGQEIGTALRDRRFPMRSPLLLDDVAETAAPEAAAPEADEATRWLRTFGDEPALMEQPQAKHFENLDVVFFAGDAAQTRRHFAALRGHEALALDVVGALRDEPQAELLAPGAALGAASGLRPRLIAIPHPASLVLLEVLRSVHAAAPLSSASAVVVEPASERGQAGIFELQQQTLGLLRFQSLPTEIFDVQVSFNLRAGLGSSALPDLTGIGARIGREVAHFLALGGNNAPPPPAVQVLQGALFHSHAISLCLRTTAPATASALQHALQAAGLVDAEPEMPDPVAATGKDTALLGPVVADAAAPQSFWIFAAQDNLRRRALCAVDLALACLGTKPRPQRVI